MACSSPPAPSIEQVSPSKARANELPLQAVVRGRNLAGGLAFKLDDDSPPTLDPRVEAWLGDAAVPAALGDVRDELVITVPTTLGIGSYDLLVAFSDGRRVAFEDAFTVLAGDDADGGASGGAGGASPDGRGGTGNAAGQTARDAGTDSTLSEGGAGGLGDGSESLRITINRLWAEFLEPQRLSISSNGRVDGDPWLSSDRQELYFRSERGGGEGDIWVVRRTSPDAEWGQPEAVAVLNSPALEEGPTLTPDGLLMLFSSRREGDDLSRLYQSTRKAVDAPWRAPVLLDWAGEALRRPKLDETGSVFYAAVGGADSDGDIYWSTFSPDAPGSVGPLADLRSESDEFDALARLQQRLVVFSADGAGSGQLGNRELYWATRESAEDVFEYPQPLSQLNSELEEDGFFITPELDLIYFTRDHELYEAVRRMPAP